MAISRMRNEKMCNLALTCDRIAYELGYGADTMFHRTYFLFEGRLEWTADQAREHNEQCDDDIAHRYLHYMMV